MKNTLVGAPVNTRCVDMTGDNRAHNRESKIATYKESCRNAKPAPKRSKDADRDL